MPDQRFPKCRRILRRAEIRMVYDRGTPYRNAGFHLFANPRKGGGVTRIAVTATRSTGGAVVRNRLKRWARETFRLNRERFESAWDLVFNVHKRLAVAPREEFDRLFLDVLRRAKILKG